MAYWRYIKDPGTTDRCFASPHHNLYNLAEISAGSNEQLGLEKDLSYLKSLRRNFTLHLIYQKKTINLNIRVMLIRKLICSYLQLVLLRLPKIKMISTISSSNNQLRTYQQYALLGEIKVLARFLSGVYLLYFFFSEEKNQLFIIYFNPIIKLVVV